jgi:integrase
MQHYGRSKYVARFLERKGTACKGSAATYSTYLRAFCQYNYRRRSNNKQEVDAYIEDLKMDTLDPYDELAAFGTFLQKERKGEFTLSASSWRLIIKVTKRLMQFSRVQVNDEDFRDLVSLSRQERHDRRPISKREIIELLNGARDMRLKTYLMFSAVSGARPIELCAIRLKDLDLQATTTLPSVTFRAEFSKMRKACTRYIASELKRQIELWLETKYRALNHNHKAGWQLWWASMGKAAGQARRLVVCTMESIQKQSAVGHFVRCDARRACSAG